MQQITVKCPARSSEYPMRESDRAARQVIPRSMRPQAHAACPFRRREVLGLWRKSRPSMAIVRRRLSRIRSNTAILPPIHVGPRCCEVFRAHVSLATLTSHIPMEQLWSTTTILAALRWIVCVVPLSLNSQDFAKAIFAKWSD